MSHNNNVAKLEWARAAFAAAHSRFQNSLSQEDQQVIWTALGETLFWTSALNDTYRGAAEAKAESAMRDLLDALPVPKSERGQRKAIAEARGAARVAYETHRNNDPDGKGVAAMTIPRNSVVHALSNLVMERTEDSDILWQPRFVPIEDMNLDREQNEDAKAILKDSGPIRYQVRRANYFFIRRRENLEYFLENDLLNEDFMDDLRAKASS